MSQEREHELAVLAARAREAMASGSTLDDVLRTFRDDEGLGSVESMFALLRIAPMELTTAKLVVSSWCEGRSYAHLTLADLDVLGDVARVAGVDFFTRRFRDDAIIDRKPYILYWRERDDRRCVRYLMSATPPERPLSAASRAGSISGHDVTYERVCSGLRAAVAAWPSDLRIIRDEPDELLLHCIRARGPL